MLGFKLVAKFLRPQQARTINVQSIILPHSNRFARTAFIGRLESEGRLAHNLFLTKFINETDQHLDTGDTTQFIATAFRTQKRFETLDPDSSLYFDPYLAFNGPLSPLNEHYQKIYRLAFNKILATKCHKERIMSNHSGYYFTGGRGIGKTTTLRVCATTLAQLLPNNILTVYIDYASNQRPPLRPSQLIAYAMSQHAVLKHRLSSEEHDRYLAASDKTEIPIDYLLHVAEKNNVSIAFFADELQDAYVHTVWSELHTLCTSLKHSLFVTGSDAILPMMVCSEPSHREYLSSRYDILSSLNDTKLQRSHVTPLTNPNQYWIYLKNRPSLVAKLFPDIEGGERVFESTDTIPGPDHPIITRIKQIHLLCGGRLRGLQASDLSSGNYPTMRYDLCEHELLKTCFAEKFVKMGFDPFRQMNVSTNEMVKFIMREDPKKDPLTLITSLVDSNWLHRLYRGDYQLSLPILNLHILGWKPTIFISHAYLDRSTIESHVDKILNNTGVTSSMCEMLNAITAMSERSIEAWERDQTRLDIPEINQMIMAVITPNYVNRYLTGDSGVFREWTRVRHHLKSGNQSKIIVVRHEILDIGSVVDVLFKDIEVPYIYDLEKEHVLIQSRIIHPQWIKV